MAAATARVRRIVSTTDNNNNDDGHVSSTSATTTTTPQSPPCYLTTELSDNKLHKVLRREKEQTNYLYGVFCLFVLFAVGGANHLMTIAASERENATSYGHTTTTTTTTTTSSKSYPDLLERAKHHHEQCRIRKEDQFDRRTSIPYRNHSLPALPAFGVLEDFETLTIHNKQRQQDQQSCHLPPITACEEMKLTVIFLAYNPDRLKIMYMEMKKLISYDFVLELVLVWNGQRDIYESIDYAQRVIDIARVVYPIRDHGLPNDLLNRYHPEVLGKLQTDCLLYYDDDGPFYSREAILSAFELWKRNSRHQIGAMARHIRSSSQPTKPIIPDETMFTPYCANDTVQYEFRFFANYDAHMVLPSGSLFHRNYLCYIWHDSMKTIRQFVLDHPVHPDDMTVSMLISQLAGVAPKVYSRRLRAPEIKSGIVDAAKQKRKKKRRLMEEMERVEYGGIANPDDHDNASSLEQQYEDHVFQQYTVRRRLAAAGMGGVCWDCGSGMTEQKEIWAYLRTEAIASLVRYFGSLTTGSIGWCPVDSSFYRYDRDGRCVPDMAELGSLPWMKPDGSAKGQCP